jgi:hypothetical protein
VHLANGIWGLLAVGLFAEESRLEMAGFNSNHKGWFYSWGEGSRDATRLAAQFVAVLWIIGWTTAMAIPFFFVLNLLDFFRVPPEVELQGLDLANQHGGVAYNVNASNHGATNYIWQADTTQASEEGTTSGGGCSVPDEEEDLVTLQDEVLVALVQNIDGTNDSEEDDIHFLGSVGTQTAQAG